MTFWKVPIHLANRVSSCASPGQGKSAADRGASLCPPGLHIPSRYAENLATNGWLHGDPASRESAMAERTWHLWFAFGDSTSCLANLVEFIYWEVHRHIESSIPARESQFGTFSVFYQRQGKQRVPTDQSKGFKRQNAPRKLCPPYPCSTATYTNRCLEAWVPGSGSREGALNKKHGTSLLHHGWSRVTKNSEGPRLDSACIYWLRSLACLPLGQAGECRTIWFAPVSDLRQRIFSTAAADGSW